MPEIDKLLGEYTRLVPRSRHHYALAEERLGFVPVELLPELDDLPHHDDGRRAELRRFHFGDDVLERTGHDPLVRARAPLDERHGRFGVPAVRDEIVHDILKVLHAHEEHERADAGCDLVPVHFRFRLGRVFVSGDKGNACRVLAMGQRDAGVSRHRRGRGHAGDDLKRDVVIGKLFGLFSSPAEDEGVSAFQPRDELSLSRLPDDKAVDLILRERVPAPLLANVNELRVRTSLLEQALVGEIVVDDHVGPFDALQALDCDQSRISGSRSY